MSCSEFEQLIALYVEEDLASGERGHVEAHLQKCSSCWDLAEGLKESQAAFKSTRQDVPDAAALSVVRERVLSEVSGLETMTWFERFLFGGLRRKAALAGIAVIVVGSGALWLERSPLVTPVAPTAVTVNRAPAVAVPPAASEPQPVPVRAPLPLRPTAKRAQHPPPASEGLKQVAIKFITDDPNVIIYWLVDEKGD